MLRLFFAASIIFIYTSSFGQDYIVTIQEDTIKGKVRALTYGAEKKVQIEEPGKKKVVYPFFKVKSFSIEGETYQPVKGPDGYTFMKLVKPGYLSLFAFQHKDQTTYDGLFLAKKDGTGTEVPNLTFKKGMRRFLDDCPSVATKIENDIYNKKDLNKIVDEYNACMTASPAPVAPEKPVVVQPAPSRKSTTAWDALESKVKSEPDFAGKEDALEMIGEIKNKISTSQKIPNFLIEGVKTSLNQDVFKAELENALKEIN